MPNITIGGTIINFPDAGSEQSWAAPVIQFAEAVQNQFLANSSPFNVSVRVQNLTDQDSNLAISGFSFDGTFVRKFVMSYAIYRRNVSTEIVENGTLTAIYNTNDNLWILQDEFVGTRQSDGTAYHSFAMNGSQVELTTVNLSSSTTATISASAITELVSNI